MIDNQWPYAAPLTYRNRDWCEKEPAAIKSAPNSSTWVAATRVNWRKGGGEKETLSNGETIARTSGGREDMAARIPIWSDKAPVPQSRLTKVNASLCS